MLTSKIALPSENVALFVVAAYIKFIFVVLFIESQ